MPRHVARPKVGAGGEVRSGFRQAMTMYGRRDRQASGAGAVATIIGSPQNMIVAQGLRPSFLGFTEVTIVPWLIRPMAAPERRLSKLSCPTILSVVAITFQPARLNRIPHSMSSHIRK